jgi:pyruvate kinase
VIEKMTQIIKAVENSVNSSIPQNTPQIKNKRFITKTICRHAAIMSDAIKAKAICTLTNSGYIFKYLLGDHQHILVFYIKQKNPYN